MNLRCMSYCLVFKEIMTPQGCRRKPSRSFGQRRVAVEDVGCRQRPSHSFGECKGVVEVRGVE
jgi:hypothetical protein